MARIHLTFAIVVDSVEDQFLSTRNLQYLRTAYTEVGTTTRHHVRPPSILALTSIFSLTNESCFSLSNASSRLWKFFGCLAKTEAMSSRFRGGGRSKAKTME